MELKELFDEETEIRTAGRDYVERGRIEHNETNLIHTNLAAENAELKRKLIEAQDKIIKLMEERNESHKNILLLSVQSSL